MTGDSFSELKLLTVSEVAAILKMKEQAILKKLQNRDIKGYKLGKEWRIKEEDILAWFEGRSNWNLLNELKNLLPVEIVSQLESDLVSSGKGGKGKNEELMRRIVSFIGDRLNLSEDKVGESVGKRV